MQNIRIFKIIDDIEKICVDLHLEGTKLLTKFVTGTGVKRLRNNTYKMSWKEWFKRTFLKAEKIVERLLFLSKHKHLENVNFNRKDN